ncbi:MAG: hypothetical protein QOF95_1407 [Pseudonocardiales bacterium]|jgi:uncharacterized protein YjbJ (UPF0337 family)|nr:hypothetical protein [Pseudonocardiales bacterium]
MTNDDTAHEARKGLLDSIAGKAKEVAGALAGNDTLAEEGQLQQADAAARREANSQDAIADAETTHATDELREQQQVAADERRDAYERAGEQQRAVQDGVAAERTQAEIAAQRQERAARAAADAAATREVHQHVAEAQSIRSDADAAERAAARDHDRLVSDAETEERRAAELRAQATNQLGGRL